MLWRGMERKRRLVVHQQMPIVAIPTADVRWLEHHSSRDPGVGAPASGDPAEILTA